MPLTIGEVKPLLRAACQLNTLLICLSVALATSGPPI
jgi:hypothetical protein